MFSTEIKSKVNEDICILIQPDNYSQSFICECGDASDLTIKDCLNAECIFISHTHIDHFINFDTILRHQIGCGKRVIICGPKGILEQAHSKIKGYTWNLIEKGAIIYEIREIIDENKIEVYEIEPPSWKIKKVNQIDGNIIFQNDRMTVTFTSLDHKIPTIAYLFKEEDNINIDLSKSNFKGGSWIKELKSAYKVRDSSAKITVENNTYEAQELFDLISVKKGHSVGIIMDHAAHSINHEKIKETFSGCDKIFIECFYKAEDKDAAFQNYHSYSEQSGKIMRECGVKEAIPVHFSRKYSEEQIKELMGEFYEAFESS